MSHISQKLADRIDAAVGIAIDRVQDGDVERCGVTVTFIVGRDKNGNVIAKASVKDGGKAPEQMWYPTTGGQQAFAEFAETIEEMEDVDSVTFETPGREPVTLGRGKE